MKAEDGGLGWRLSLFLVAYRALWYLLAPGVLVYFWRRGRREPVYRQFFGERFGGGHLPEGWSPDCRPLWVHCASLGEFRGAAPLIRALLDQGRAILFSTVTPAGRGAAQKLFAAEIAAHRLAVVWSPLEFAWAVRRLIGRWRPRAAMMCEIDTWPVLVTTIRAAGVPLAMANAQYPGKSLVRDLRWGGIRSRLFRCYQLVLCKSETHAARFRQVGCRQVAVVGETRFDLPIPPQQLSAAARCRSDWGLENSERPVILIASSVADEDALLVAACRRLRDAVTARGGARPLFVHVPRSPQRFDLVARMNEEAGLTVARRSRVLDAALEAAEPVDLGAIDVLLGDSLGEMHFFIALSQIAVVGASFVPLGAHNIIEPLAQKKPVVVGPSIWGIEYPGVEALAAGVLTQCDDVDALVAHLENFLADASAREQAAAKAEAFYREHAGSTRRHMEALSPWLAARA